jgi:mono/diheme cytochrome c family protein
MRKLLFLVVVIALGSVGFSWLRHQKGFSARDEPSALERFLATAMRRAAVPTSVREIRNPFPPSRALLDRARQHFADHCASCHANDGSGDVEMGRNLYPRAPDMRMAGTQSLTDGELYWIIHNGIRLSGMPAWGDPNHDEDSWHLVAFIRHLPSLTAEELIEMERFNPKSPAELEEEERDREFLAGEDEPVRQSSAEGRSRK